MFFQLTEHLKKHIFHLAWSPENLPTVDAIYPLLDFLDRRLQEVNRCLLYGNYIRCLHVIWDTVVLQLKEYADISTVWFMLILWLNISIVIRYKVCVMSSTQELVEIHNLYCCVFWPANRCSTHHSLVEIDFLMLKQLFPSLTEQNKQNKEGLLMLLLLG